MGVLVNAIAGFLFGLGLVIGGMANPAKVLNFLDLAGSWDASFRLCDGGCGGSHFHRLQAGVSPATTVVCRSISLIQDDADRQPLGVRRSDLWRRLGTFRLLPRTCDHLAPATR